jgi:demethylmenaquinone methyltransferase/2-methoxy-6-polyprenyl-1,4-benzoquinol methylase
VTSVGLAPSRRSNKLAVGLFSPLAHRYDLLCEVLSMGQNRRWRRAMIDPIADRLPLLALDVATGTAGVAIQLARRCGTKVIGVDVTLPMLRTGLNRVKSAGLRSQIALASGRAEQLPFVDESFDAVTFTYLLRYVEDPAATLVELARVLKPGAPMASLEFLVPPKSLWRAAWWCYTRILLPPAGWISGGRPWWRVGRFLGPSIAAHYRRYPIAWMVQAWESAGLVDVHVRVLSMGGGLVMWGRRAGG